MTKLGVYVHHADGARYTVLGVATDSTNGVNCGRRMVVYVSLTTGKLLTRRESQFHEVIKAASGDRVPRFKLEVSDA